MNKDEKPQNNLTKKSIVKKIFMAKKKQVNCNKKKWNKQNNWYIKKLMNICVSKLMQEKKEKSK